MKKVLRPICILLAICMILTLIPLGENTVNAAEDVSSSTDIDSDISSDISDAVNNQGDLATSASGMTLYDSSTYTFDVSGTYDFDEAAEVLKQLNALRTSLGKSELVLDKELSEAAMQRAAETSIYWSHSRPNGEGCFTAIPSSYSNAGENIAVGQTSASEVYTAWFNSSGHYANMISSNYDAVGIGCFYQVNGTKYWVQLFTGGKTNESISVSGTEQVTRSITSLSDYLSLSLSPSSTILVIGDTEKVTLYNKNSGFSNLTEINPTYCTTSDAGIATVDKNGQVSGIGRGSATLKLGVDSSIYAEASVKVIGKYTITASAGTGGSISPSGSVSVIEGNSQVYTITANTGYEISDVLVDGNSVGEISSYTFDNVTVDHTISAEFKPLYTINASAGTGGNISPSGSISIREGKSQTYTITANAGYEISNVIVDGNSVGEVSSYTFDNISAGHTISAEFKPLYTINATASTGGSISPSGSISIREGKSQTFNITADNGYVISNVIVDGNSVGEQSSYTFDNITEGHTISAEFKAIHTINASAGTGGSISPSGSVSVREGNNQTFNITTNAGYEISNVIVDGKSVGEMSSYTFDNVTEGHTISAEFKPVYTINASAGTGGSISPSGSVSVREGDSKKFTITANAGYVISNVIVDGKSEGTISEFNFSNVTGEHSISVEFEEAYTINTTAGTGGSISPSGIVSVREGDNQTFTITPNSGYKVSSVTVDGTSVGAVTTYTFDNVTDNHSISAEFEEISPVLKLNTTDNSAYIDGYDNGTVRPEAQITREEVAMVFYRLLTEESRAYFETDTNDFSDVESSRWSNTAISTLANAGVLNGYDNGTFKPDSPITRAELVKIVVVIIEDGISGENLNDPFSDVSGHWADAYILTAANAGWINGYDDDTFRPDKNIIRAEAMAIVNRVLGRDDSDISKITDMKEWSDNADTSKWYYNAVQIATNSY